MEKDFSKASEDISGFAAFIFAKSKLLELGFRATAPIWVGSLAM